MADCIEPVTPIAQTTVKPNVLIVDDDSIVHLLYGRYLAQAGYEVLTAKNGQEAMAVVSRETVHLIVMDIMMPGGDGLSVLRELRNSEVGRNIPVIIVTANVENYRTAMRDSMNSGAERFLPKPTRASRLLIEVNQLVPLPPQPTRPSRQNPALDSSGNGYSEPSPKMRWDANANAIGVRPESDSTESE
jgi:two-component system phosphate regulon response regulator OmpR